MIKLGVLVSGEGTNLQAILDAIASKKLDAKVQVVISNRATAGGLERARKASIPAVFVDHRSYLERTHFDAEVVQVLQRYDAEYVVLAGFMRIATSVLLDAFPMRVLNIHPSLLPAFPGMDAQLQALRYGVRISGCTVHFVDTGTDTGPILAQAAVPVFADDDERTLGGRILEEEHRLLPTVLQWMAEGRVHIEPNMGGTSRPKVFLRPA